MRALSLVSMLYLVSLGVFAAQKQVITNKGEMERLRSEVSRSWSSYRPTAAQTDVVEIAKGELEEGMEDNLCQYLFEGMIYTSHYTPSQGFSIERELIGWDLGPETTADDVWCEQNANGAVDAMGMSMGANMLINIDKFLSTFGTMTGAIKEAKLKKITSQTFQGIELFHFTYFISGTTSDDLDIDIPGMGDASPNLDFEIELTITFGKDVIPAAVIWQNHVKINIDGVVKETVDQAIIKYNGIVVPPFQF